MNLQVTSTTEAEFRETQEVLMQELDRLAEITEHYPVICMLAGRTYVFTSRDDILSLIEEIKQAVATYDQEAA